MSKFSSVPPGTASVFRARSVLLRYLFCMQINVTPAAGKLWYSLQNLLSGRCRQPLLNSGRVACAFFFVRANFIIVVPGANYQLTPADVATAGAKLKGSKVIVVSEGVLGIAGPICGCGTCSVACGTLRLASAAHPSKFVAVLCGQLPRRPSPFAETKRHSRDAEKCRVS